MTDLFLYGSTLCFWLLMAVSVFKIVRARKGTNEKVRMNEKVVAVIKKAGTDEKISIQ